MIAAPAWAEPPILSPADGWYAPAKARFPMCAKALKPDSYTGSNAQLFEADTGWLYRDQEINGRLDPDPALFAMVRTLTEQLRKNGTQLIVVVTPPRAILSSRHLTSITPQHSVPDTRSLLVQYLYLQMRLKGAGAAVPDILGEANSRRVAWQYLTSPHDVHWSPIGAQVAGYAVAKIIRSDPQIAKQPIPPLLISRAAATSPIEGYYQILNGICAESFPYPTEQLFLPPQSTSEAGGLLATPKTTSAVIVGTSFSALDHRYNFSGYVEAAAGIDTINLALAGGGPLQSIVQYLASGELARAKPKFLIWEMTPTNIPARDDLLEFRGYLSAACADGGINAARRLLPGETTLFDRRALAQIEEPGAPALLMLNSDSAALKVFSVVVRSLDGARHVYRIDFSRASSLNPQYRLALPNLAAARSIGIQPHELMSGKVAAKICTLGASQSGSTG